MVSTGARRIPSSCRNADPSCPAHAAGRPHFHQIGRPAGACAQEHRRPGYRAAYGPKVEANDTDRIKAIIKEFSARDVIIAEVGGWCNMLDSDPEKRRKNMAKVQDRLAVAELLGARTCPNIAGSYNSHSWCGPHPAEPHRRIHRRHRGELPQRHRRRQADAHQVLHRDDALQFSHRTGRLSEIDQACGSRGHSLFTWMPANVSELPRAHVP